ncbi:MAG: Hsp33 family molecular chaperone HslO, partial [Clostridia bacterium]|nr:Hsp33 family molecular chaperone HslO [Clostridia bacterium]
MKDYIVRAVTFDGAVRCSAAVTTNMVDQARRLHNLSPTASAALGRLLTAVSMMGNMMKGEDDRLTVQIDGKGPIGRLTAVSDSEGMVKGYVDNPLVD